MRFLDTTTLELVELITTLPNQTPYAVLSHRWRSDEVLYKEYLRELQASPLQNRKSYVEAHRFGLVKIIDFCNKAREDGYSLAWIDTCCINKESSAETQEAINAMYDLYAMSDRCYVFLADVEDTCSNWAQSDWWHRGWTLPELIAPEHVAFYDKDWNHIGDKAAMAQEIATVAGLPEDVLIGKGREKLAGYSAREIFSWESSRRTTRVEDEAYCAMGLLDVNMPVSYGQGAGAFTLLQQEVFKRGADQSILAFEAEPTEEAASLFASSPKQFICAKTSEVFQTKTWRAKPPTLSGHWLEIVAERPIRLEINHDDDSVDEYSGKRAADPRTLGKALSHEKAGRKEVYIVQIDCERADDRSACYIALCRYQTRGKEYYVRVPCATFGPEEAILQELKTRFSRGGSHRTSRMQQTSFRIRI